MTYIRPINAAFGTTAISASLCAAIVAVALPSFAQFPTPPPPVPVLYTPIAFYDTEGTAGLLNERLEIGDHRTEFTFENGTTVSWVGIGRYNSAREDLRGAVTLGTPYLVRYQSPLVMEGRPVMAWGRIFYEGGPLYYYDYYDMLPIKASETGWKVENRGESLNIQYINATVSVGDSNTYPSYVAEFSDSVDFASFPPVQGHSMNVSVDYFPDNSLYDLFPSQQVFVEPSWCCVLRGATTQVYWGDPSFASDDDPGRVQVYEEFFEGSVKVAMQIDPFLSDSVVISTPNSLFSWKPLFAYSKGPSDTYSRMRNHPAPPDWILERALTAMVEENAVLITYLWSYADVNGDGERDARDLGALRAQMRGRDTWEVS